jgi:hypothetical protein
MTPAQLRTRMIGTLAPACFAGSNVGRVFDCPLRWQGGPSFDRLDDKPPTYLFYLAVFCNCEPQEVALESSSVRSTSLPTT